MGGDSAPSHSSEYQRRLDLHAAEEFALERRSAQLSNLRLLVFAVGAAASWFVFGTRSLEAAWLAPAVIGFVALVILHDRALQARDRAGRAVAFYEGGLARLEDRWLGSDAAARAHDRPEWSDPHHPYAEDLDLFGRGSLFELLCGATTQSGEETLARWLLEPASPETVRSRQQAVKELAGKLDLRVDLARQGAALRERLHPDALTQWGSEPVKPVARSLRVSAALLAAMTVGTLAAWLLAGAFAIWFALAAGAQSVFALFFRGRIHSALSAGGLPVRELAALGGVLRRIEGERFESPRLLALQGRLEGAGVRPSQQVARLVRLVEFLDARRNQIFAPIGALLLFSTQIAFAIESWRAECGPRIADWIAAVGEFEALCSIAGFAYENPDHTYPEIDDDVSRFEARGLGHPLLPRANRVRNGVSMGGDLQVLVVSGSNMSGKSTMLRTIGVNAVLALAGSPVCAEMLRISPLAIGASIRVQDSLLEGSSRFYAEITRLRQIVEISEGSRPALFLLDEILHGTNSHDRGIGAAAVVRSLVERGALGLVTTHDLALAKVADELGEKGRNVHFEDHLEAGKIVFDYQIRPGVVSKSNALELMRSVGLDV